MPALPPPPLETPLARGDTPSPTWARWLRQLWEAARGTPDCAVVASKSSDQTGVATATVTLVTFPTVSEDDDAVWDTANSRYVARYAGLYAVHARVHWLVSGTTGTLGLLLYKNGVREKSFTQVASSGAWGDSVSTWGTLLVRLAADDYIDVRGIQSTGANRSIWSGDLTGLEIRRVGD